MKKALALIVLALLSMYYVPQVWYVLIALMLFLFVALWVFIGLFFIAKALGITALEFWIAQKILRRKKV